MITARITSPQNALGRFDRPAERLNKAVQESVVKEAIHLVAYVKQNKLSDQILRVRTGRLRRSITAQFEGEGTGKFRAIVGTNVQYARIHEYGFNGVVNVRQHTVKEHSRKQSIAFGKQIAPRTVTVRAHSVRAHTMNMKVRARPFLHPALEENAERITANIRKAIAEAMK